MVENITVEQAAELMLAHTAPLTETEEVNLLDALGKILARDAVAEIDNPPFNRSPVDGYACCSEDIQQASSKHPVRLKVLEEIDAGSYSGVKVRTGEAVRIMTGAPIPSGCDCCVRQEDTDCNENEVCIYAGVKKWKNYCFQGEDFKKGTRMLEAGSKIQFVEAGILASMGKSQVLVYRKPRIALLTTGDEVVPPGTSLSPGKIYNSNQTILAARMRELGICPVLEKSVPDKPEILGEEIKKAVENADLVITTGGVSVGKKDILHEVMENLGAVRIFWRVKLKPGTPSLFSLYQETPVISLSGNPFGAAANFELLVRPVLAKMARDSRLLPVRKKA